MYGTLKNALKSMLPDNMVFRHELKLRSLLYQFYRGSNFHCNICGKDLRRFVRLPDGDRLCPYCGSLARDRRLWRLLLQANLGGGLRILDFSPSRCLSRQLKLNDDIKYMSSDYAGEFPSDQHYDITNIALPDCSFDLILCYHVLEHVENDRMAMKELFRVLDSGGTCIIQTPFREGGIYENALLRTPEERALHFGQSDHLRIYSVNGLKERLEASGFQVEVREFHNHTANRDGFDPVEFILIASKTVG